MRTIDKVGGLDAYLFRMKPERLGQKGMELRQRVSSTFPSSISSIVEHTDTDPKLSLLAHFFFEQVQEAHARAKLERRTL